MRTLFVHKRFTAEHEAVIEQANDILQSYADQGYSMTLRQLYYQFVARALIPNNMRSYKRLGSIINDARLAGRIDWRFLEDRTRSVVRWSHYANPGSVVLVAAQSYAIDRWVGQDYRVEVWIEKDALAGVINDVCAELDIDYFACRGYVSQSEMYTAAQRLKRYEADGQDTIILHLGDHDPSGIDMTNDIANRLSIFESSVEVRRIALNMDQIEQYDPPPNPAKITDSRARGYIEEYGDESWELDALEPAVLNELIRDEVGPYLDQEMFDARQEQEEQERALVERAADNWPAVAEFLEGLDA